MLEERQITTVLESAHAGDRDLVPWLDGLVETTAATLPRSARVVAAVIRRRPKHWELVAGDAAAHANGPLSAFGVQLPHIPPRVMDAYYRRPERVATHLEICARDPHARDVGDAFVRALGVTDSVAMIAQAPGGYSMVVFALSEERIALSVRERLLMSRAAAHVESALRTRFANDERAPTMVDASGRVLHAEGAAKQTVLRDAIVAHVRGIERARSKAKRHDADDATAAWKALVGGRYGVVERVDGGRRTYHVVAHPEHVWSGRALRDVEARVLEMSARGMQAKLVAYSLGISQAVVSESLARAAAKLGYGTRNELVALAAEVLRPDGRASDGAALTGAEHRVLEGLRRGWTNAAIASEHGTSEHTVAKQVSSIMKKTARGSRRAIAAMPSPVTRGGRRA